MLFKTAFCVFLAKLYKLFVFTEWNEYTMVPLEQIYDRFGWPKKYLMSFSLLLVRVCLNRKKSE